MHGKRRVLGVEDVTDEDKYDEVAELPAKGSRTPLTEKRKIIRKPKFIRGQCNVSSSPCTRELSYKTSLSAYSAT